jgi:hypothetical protein
MPELGPSGSARGAVSNHRPYRDPQGRSIFGVAGADFSGALARARER